MGTSQTAIGDLAGTGPWLDVAGRTVRSRLLVGIEHYDSAEVAGQVLAAAGADVIIVTTDTDNDRPSLLLADLDRAVRLDDFVWIGTTSFARSRAAAIRTAQVLRESMGIDILKLDVRVDTNVPDNAATLEAARELRRSGLELLPFIQPDLRTARELEDLGCAAVRVMAAPIGSDRGIDDPQRLREIIGVLGIPVIIEGGLGRASHVARAMELGAAAVLVNTAVAEAGDKVRMAASMRHAAAAGRLCFESGTEPLIAPG
ncbi:thiosugar synthase [Actinoplanes sp. N902-109]|uniref:thiosugar synthase n=1 Tax=Actinoplanes sp. (strain N902-109) TaxID=649831 RepID=UPI00032945B7|nr:thiosugar synthase [Actinoplanes sp. N902-109]AGL18722.1 putative thiosugar synthase [Actinoplanes sp. N902-109]